MSESKRIVITGAFGTIGRETIGLLRERGHEVWGTDVHTKANSEVEAKLQRACKFTTNWLDITDRDQVIALVQDVQPQVVIHLASIIPPHFFDDLKRSEAINLGGTRHMIDAARGLAKPPLFILASSHTVHGYRNGARELPELAADTPRASCDGYTRIKIECEDLLLESGLPYTILRYGIVFPRVYSRKIDPAGLKINFIIPLDSRSHGCHVEDAGLATTRAAEGLAVGKTLMISGNDKWKQRQRFYIASILSAVGVGMLPEEAYVQGDPERDESWFYTDWMDTTEGQELLEYQKCDPEDYFRFLAKDMGLLRPLARLASPLVRRKIARMSPFYTGKADPKAPDTTLEDRIRLYATPAPRR
ncbi:MAG: NAD(P)-dependent oxidoreductase [bacterium]